MTHYSIIKDDQKFREFIDWLPDTPEGLVYYVALFARKKYCNEIKYIKTDKAQCARILSTKKDLYNKVKRLECPLGSYVIKDIVIPQEAIALYISVNPRDLKLATKNSLIKLAQLITQEYNGYNPVAEVMSEVHRAHGKKQFLDFDFDGVEFEETREKVNKLINPDCLTFVKTRGGFHMLVETAKVDNQFNKLWYTQIKALEGVDQGSGRDALLPVVGCTQGEFIPHFIK